MFGITTFHLFFGDDQTVQYILCQFCKPMYAENHVVHYKIKTSANLTLDYFSLCLLTSINTFAYMFYTTKYICS